MSEERHNYKSIFSIGQRVRVKYSNETRLYGLTGYVVKSFSDPFLTGDTVEVVIGEYRRHIHISFLEKVEY